MSRNPDWLGSEAAAHHLGITPRTLYRLIDQGAVGGFRFGRVIRLRRSDLDAFIETSRIRPGELRHLYAGDTNRGDG